MRFLVIYIYSREINTCMCKQCRNMVNLSEQSLPKSILYTVLDILIRLIDNEGVHDVFHFRCDHHVFLFGCNHKPFSLGTII